MPIATLQSALTNGTRSAPTLQVFSDRVNADAKGSMPFDPANCLAPLPRAYQWADGSAYVNHVALVRKARGAEMPESFRTDPLMYQGGSDTFLGPREPIQVPTSWGIDFEAEIAVVTGDVPHGHLGRTRRASAIRLVMLVNDVSLRNLDPGPSSPRASASSMPSPPRPSRRSRSRRTSWAPPGMAGACICRCFAAERPPFGCPDAGIDMTFDFPTLVAHAAKTRRLAAGTIIGSGTVSNRGADGGPGQADRRRRASAIPASPSSAWWKPSSAASGQDAVPEIRRPGADRDAGCRRQVDLRRHRPDRGSVFPLIAGRAIPRP